MDQSVPTESTSTQAAPVQAGQRVVVGLLAERDMPHRVAELLRHRLPHLLRRRINPDVHWETRVAAVAMPLDEEGNLPMFDIAERHQDELGWDVAILLTDLPRRAGTTPIASDFSVDRGVGLASLPALGAVRLHRRAADLAVHLVSHLVEGRVDQPHRSAYRDVHNDGLVARLLAPTRHLTADDDDPIDAHLALGGLRGRFRLLCGMVRNNQPWRLALGMNKLLAAALATSAITIATSTMWLMAVQLSVPRQVIAMVASVATLVFWIVVFHGLWERRRHRASAEEAVLFNVATAVTLSLGVLALYLVLFGLDLLAVWFLITTRAFAKYAGARHANFDGFAMLAWLTVSLSSVAGAVGSSLEDVDTVRRAAYGRRERERIRRRLEAGETGQAQEGAEEISSTG